MAQGRNNTRYRYLTLRNEYGALGKVYRTAFPGFGTGGGALQENLRARTSLEASRRRFRFSKLLLRLQTSLPTFSLLFSSAFGIRSLVHLYQACSKRRAMACSPATQGTRRTAYVTSAQGKLSYQAACSVPGTTLSYPHFCLRFHSWQAWVLELAEGRIVSSSTSSEPSSACQFVSLGTQTPCI